MKKIILIVVISLGFFSLLGLASVLGATSFSESLSTITVLSPNGGEVFNSGDTVQIRWESKNAPLSSFVLMEVAAVDGSTGSVQTQRLSSTGVFEWDVPTNVFQTGQYVVNVTLYNSSSRKIAEDSSDSSFTINIHPTVDLIFPNGGVSLVRGNTVLIRWQSFDLFSDNLDNVITQLLLVGGPPNFRGAPYTRVVSVLLPLGKTLPANGTFEWNIPESIAPDSDYKIFIGLSGIPPTNDISDDFFSIIPDITITPTPSPFPTPPPPSPTPTPSRFA